MARAARHHLPTGEYGDMTPKHLSKLEFARRLNRLMNERGWNQSELARQAEIGRDAVSTYIRGRSFPEPANLAALAKAFDMEPGELLPNAAENAMDNDTPSYSMQEAAGHKGKAWLRVNQMVPTRLAVKILALLAEEDEQENGAVGH